MGDKRTKEVFAPYLKRITAHAGRAFARRMDGLDDGSSAPRILMPDLRLLRALQRCMSGSGLFPAGRDAYAGRAFRATGPASTSLMASLMPGAPSSDGLAYRSIIPCVPTLVCSSFATSRLGRCFLQRPFLCVVISELKLLVSYIAVGKPCRHSEIEFIVSLVAQDGRLRK